jgi:hypothetical protein
MYVICPNNGNFISVFSRLKHPFFKVSWLFFWRYLLCLYIPSLLCIVLILTRLHLIVEISIGMLYCLISLSYSCFPPLFRHADRNGRHTFEMFPESFYAFHVLRSLFLVYNVSIICSSYILNHN